MDFDMPVGQKPFSLPPAHGGQAETGLLVWERIFRDPIHSLLVIPNTGFLGVQVGLAQSPMAALLEAFILPLPDSKMASSHTSQASSHLLPSQPPLEPCTHAGFPNSLLHPPPQLLWPPTARNLM